MKCFRCGYESNDSFKFCPICGLDVSGGMPFVINPAADRVLAIIKDKLFLAFCILMTVSCLLAMYVGSFDIISILIVIFSWLTFAKGTKNIADHDNLRCISGTVYAYYVIINIAAIISIVCGIVVGFGFSILSDSVNFAEEILLEYESYIGNLPEATENIIDFFGIFLAVVFVVIGVLFLLINLLGLKKIHSFVKSVYKSVESGNMIYENVITAKNWIIFFAVCEGMSALSGNIYSTIVGGCDCAAMIIVVILINKYFLSTEKQF